MDKYGFKILLNEINELRDKLDDDSISSKEKEVILVKLNGKIFKREKIFNTSKGVVV